MNNLSELEQSSLKMLRVAVDLLGEEIVALRNEVARLRLTDEEREAVEWAATASDREQKVAFEAAGAGYNPEKASVWADNHAARAATLRGLLERTK